MENPHVFFDNTSPEIFFNGTQWEVDASDSSRNTFGGSQSVCHTDRAGDGPPSLKFNFTGKGLEVYGTLDRSLVMRSFMDKTNYTSLDDTAGIPSGRKGVKIFDLGVLSGPHTVVLEPRQGQLIVDYLIYTPVGNTLFDGKQLIYDDTNPSFNFSGSWTPAKDFNLSALPFNDTYISTGQIGSSFAVDFVGNSVSVYGAFNPSPGVVSATFSVDGSTPSPIQLLNRTASADDWTMHQLFFQHNFTEVSEIPHVLNVTVVNASDSQPFFLDYVITTGNSHTKLAVRQFKKEGSQLKSVGLKVGLIVLGIAIALFLWYLWTTCRARRKRAKGLAELSKP